MASFRPCLLAVLGTLLILSACMAPTESASCCLRYTRRKIPPCRVLKTYKLQSDTSSCDIKAVIFLTKKPGGFICADSSKDLTWMRVQCLNGRHTHSKYF